MLKKLIFTYLLILVIIFSCKKKEVQIESIDDNTNSTEINTIDTIKPNSYFPCYPGSYWYYSISYYYSDQYSDTTYYSTQFDTLKSGSNYIKDVYRNNIGELSDTCYVPTYENQPVWGYQFNENPIFYTPSLKRFLSEDNLNFQDWVVPVPGMGNAVTMEVYKLPTPLFVSGVSYINVKRVTKKVYGTIAEVIYYAKDVGIVKIERPSTSSFGLTSSLTTYYLEGYHINN